MSSKMGARFKTLFSCTSGKRPRKHRRYLLFCSLFSERSLHDQSRSVAFQYFFYLQLLIFCCLQLLIFLTQVENLDRFKTRSLVSQSSTCVMFFQNLRIRLEYFSGTKISLLYKLKCVLLRSTQTNHFISNMTKIARNSKELSVIEFSDLADIANIISNRRRFGEVAKSYDCRGTQ